MNEPNFITREMLEERRNYVGYKSNKEIAEMMIDMYYTLDKMYLAIETTQQILNHLSEIKFDEKEIEQERWKKLGEDFQQVREQYTMSRHSLANILGITYIEIDQIERGEIDPTPYLREAVEMLNKE